MAAARQGHFWDFVTYVLDHQDGLREQDLIAYAAKLGLDESRFAETIRQRRYAAKVEAESLFEVAIPPFSLAHADAGPVICS